MPKPFALSADLEEKTATLEQHSRAARSWSSNSGAGPSSRVEVMANSEDTRTLGVLVAEIQLETEHSSCRPTGLR